MAELKVDERQYMQPGPPDISAAAEGVGLINTALQSGAKKIGEVIDSANKVEAELHYTEATNLLNQQLVQSMSKENMVKGDAYNRYMQTAKQIADETLPYIGGKYQSTVKNQLDNQINKFGLQLAKQEITFQEQQSKAKGQIVLSQQFDEIAEAASSGDHNALQLHESIFNDTVNNLKDIGAIDEYDAYNLEKKVQKLKVNADYSSKFEKMLREDPVAADVFLKNLGDKKPDNLTHDEWLTVQANLLQQKTDYKNAYNAAQTLGQNEYDLAFNSGLINTPQDIDNFIEKQEDLGRYFSPNDILKMRTELVRAKSKIDKDAQKLLDIDNAIKNNPNALYDFSGGDLNKYYISKSSQINQALAEQKESNPDAQIPSQLTVKASVASTLPHNIEPFSREMSDKLMFGTISDVENAIKVGDQLLRVSPKTYSMLPKETQSYHNLVKTLYGNTTLNLEQIRDYANKSVAPKDEATQQMINKKLADLHKTGFYKSLYKDIYNTRFVNPALQPQFNNVSKVFDTFYNISGDKSIATDLTKNYMNVNSGTSEFIPKYDVTRHPIEKTQEYINNPIFIKNQMAVGANEIILNYEHAKEKGYPTAYTVEWPDGIKRPDFNKIPQKDYVEKPIMVNEKGKEVPIQLKINGKNRKLFLMNPNTDLEDPSRDQRQYYFEDDFGIPQPLYVSGEFRQTGGYINVDSGIPSIQFRSIAQIVPEYYKDVVQKSYDDKAIKLLRQEYKSKQIEKAEPIVKSIPKPGSYYNAKPHEKKESEYEKEKKKESEYIEKNLKNKSKAIEADINKKIAKLNEAIK